jgi:general secretion pathway protein E
MNRSTDTGSVARRPNPARRPATDEADGLQRIHGIGPAFVRTLHRLGITSIDQIANFTPGDVERVSAALGKLGDRVVRHDWIGQARALRAPAPDADHPCASEFRDEDLTQILGIGPAFERTLHRLGINSITQIANFTHEDVEHVSTALGRLGDRVLRNDWVGQARALCASPTVASDSLDAGAPAQHAQLEPASTPLTGVTPPADTATDEPRPEPPTALPPAADNAVDSETESTHEAPAAGGSEYDELKSIRGITPEHERISQPHDGTGFAQTAPSSREDSDRVSATQDGDNLLRDDWIEQAPAHYPTSQATDDQNGAQVPLTDDVPASAGDPEPGVPQDGHLGELLIAASRLTDEALARALRLQDEQQPRERVGSLLVKLGLASERDVARTLARQRGMVLLERKDYPDPSDIDARLPPRFLQQVHALVFDQDGRALVVMADPLDDYVLEAVSLICGDDVEACVGLSSEIESFQEQLGASGGDGAAETGDTGAGFSEDVEHLRELASEAPVIKLVNNVLQRALENRASDVHVEPFENQLRIRYRIDGVLREIDPPPVRHAPAVISRLKIMAGLNIAERRLPQDGRIKRTLQGREIDMRVSTVPTTYGESVVLRLLDRGDVSMSFRELGFNAPVRERLQEMLSLPHGIILVTGPTGSGKTTTLYTALTQLNTPERKIITVEDPVEYNLNGINQIHVKAQIGLTFASALRSIVRQDPDVIMIGEMRDTETARIAVQSALTGHLVLSTLHTNDAASSITRLLDMDVEDYLLASTVNAIVAQRLVRRLCARCRTPDMSVAEYAQHSPSHIAAPLAGREGVLYRAVGCEHCGGSGYLGRTTIAELLVIDDSVRELVMSDVDAKRIQRAATAQGMQTMFVHGVEKALAGDTTLQEVARVTLDA